MLVVTSNPDALPGFWMASLFPSYVAVEHASRPSRRSRRTCGAQAPRRAPNRPLRPAPIHPGGGARELPGRYASTFDLLEPREYEAGLDRAERELADPVEYSLELMVVVAAA